MLPACRTAGEGFAIPTFDVVPSDVEGFMEELWEFQPTFYDCFARSEPRAESDTPGKAGGLMSGAASKAVDPSYGHL